MKGLGIMHDFKWPGWLPERAQWTKWDCWRVGVVEAHLATGITFDDDPDSPRSVAYDEGRNFGESLSDRATTIALWNKRGLKA
jgi:hypothetical protein